MGNLALRQPKFRYKNLHRTQGVGCVGCKGNGGIRTGDNVGEDTLLARPMLGQTSNRVVTDTNTAFDLTIPCCSKSVELAPAPPLLQLKL